jgi:hypothetical protein
MNDLERRRRRMDRVRTLIRLELAIAFGLPLLAGFLYILMPGGGRPMFEPEPSLIDQLVPWAGGAGVILGLVWMVRLSRQDPEAGQRTWRYRDF